MNKLSVKHQKQTQMETFWRTQLNLQQLSSENETVIIKFDTKLVLLLLLPHMSWIWKWTAFKLIISFSFFFPEPLFELKPLKPHCFFIMQCVFFMLIFFD